MIRYSIKKLQHDQLTSKTQRVQNGQSIDIVTYSSISPNLVLVDAVL